VRGASDFGRGRANGCARIALQLFVRCVYALVSPPPHVMRKRLWRATRATSVAETQRNGRQAEKVFRQKSENLNKRVMCWSYGTLLVMVAIGLVQFKYMTWFFMAKKIV